jgi:hypothetical protein
VLFSVTLVSPLLARRRLEYGVTDTPALELVAQFIVGGLAQTLTAWLSGALPMSEAEPVADCAEIFTTIADRRRP